MVLAVARLLENPRCCNDRNQSEASLQLADTRELDLGHCDVEVGPQTSTMPASPMM
jgi:hypothetical protein